MQIICLSLGAINSPQLFTLADCCLNEYPKVMRTTHPSSDAVATALASIAVFVFIVALIGGISICNSDTKGGLLFFLSAVISGLIILGLARVVENTYQSAQRLRRIEMLVQKASDDKKAT